MSTLILKFAGPLQSWGTSSHFETRDTDFYPSKSAVIGIIAASFGYRRDQDAEIQRLAELSYAVRVDQKGVLMRDFHTAVSYKRNGQFDRTYVTNRYYLEDAIFLVAIGHSDEAFIDDIEEALKNPYFQTYMGRRACPVTADFLMERVTEEPVECLASYPWQAATWYQKRWQRQGRNSVSLDIYADSKLYDEGPKMLRRDQVVSFSQKERKFSDRYETKLETALPLADKKVDYDPTGGTSETKHDVFRSIGNTLGD